MNIWNIIESAYSQDLAGQSLVCVLAPDFGKGTARGILANKEEGDADNPTTPDSECGVFLLLPSTAFQSFGHHASDAGSQRR